MMYVRRCVLGTELLIFGDKSFILVIETSVSILLVLYQKRESVTERDFQNDHGRDLVLLWIGVRNGVEFEFKRRRRWDCRRRDGSFEGNREATINVRNDNSIN